VTRSGFARVKDVIAQVRDLPPDAREAKLAELCGGDEGLLDEVRSLLSHGQEPDGRLDAPVAHRGLLEGLLEERATGAGGVAADDPPSTLPELQGALGPGARIGAFTLGERLGAGGMGVVFEAVQDEPLRTVALKLLGSGGPVSRALLDRFRQEIHVLGRLDHPGIAALYEAGAVDTEDGPRPFFAMQRIAGRRLDVWFREERPGPDAIVDLLIDVADAVAHAHKSGVVHRDLKPGNLMVDASGRPTVLDFGVARLTEAHTMLSSLHTEAGELLGTLPYMSPEQVSGQVDEVDARTDVYALGVILFEALTGQLPIETQGLTVPAAALRIREQDPPSLGSVDGSLRGDLEVVVEAALAKEPERRYADAGALAADLRRFRRSQALVARPLSTLGQLVRFVRRNRALAAGAGLAALALVVATAVSLYHAGQSARDRDAALREADRSKLSAAEAALLAQEPVAARELLAGVTADGRAWEWRHLQQELATSTRPMPAVERLLDAVLVAGGEELVQVGGAGRVERSRLSDDGVLATAELAGLATSEPGLIKATLSQDGRRCVGLWGDPPRIGVWDTTSGERLAGLPVEVTVHDLALDPDGDSVLWLESERVVAWRWATESAERSREVEPSYRWRSLQVGAERYVLYSLMGFIESATLDDFASGEGTWRQRVSNQRLRATTLSEDGRRLAVSTAEKDVVVLDAADGTLLAELTGHTAATSGLAFLDEGRRLASLGRDATLRLWDVDRERQDASFSAHDGVLRRLLVAPGSLRFVGVGLSGELHLWDLDRREQQQVLRGHGSYVYALAVSPDGRSLVSASWDDSLRWWDLATGAVTRVETVDRRPVRVAISPQHGRVVCLPSSSVLEMPADSSGEPRVVFPGFSSGSKLIWTDEERLLLGSHRDAQGLQPPSWRHADSGEVLAELAVGDRNVRELALTTDRSRLATGSLDGRLDVWSFPDGQHLVSLPGHAAEVSSVALSPDDRRLASTGWDHKAWLFDTATWERLELPGHPARVHSVAWHPDGNRLATACDDGIIRVFDPEDGALVAQLRGHEDYVHDLVFTPDGTVLASASGDHTIRLWHTIPLGERLDAAGR
jgi:WD40 repeat protein/serine/threonine protein kinase